MLKSLIGFPSRAKISNEGSRKRHYLLHCFGRDKNGLLTYVKDYNKISNELKVYPNRRCRTARGIYSHYSTIKTNKRHFDKTLIRITGTGQSPHISKSRNSGFTYYGRKSQTGYDYTSYLTPFRHKRILNLNSKANFHVRKKLVNFKHDTISNTALESYSSIICCGKTVEKTDKSISKVFDRKKFVCIEGKNILIRSRNEVILRSNSSLMRHTYMKENKLDIKLTEDIETWTKPIFNIFIRKSRHAKRKVIN